ncbi:MAG: ABC transporter substrate-binding protein [Alphaproteobacteria bacterium]
MQVDVKQLSKQLTQGKITRRAFMEGAAAAGLTVSAATAMMGKAIAATPKRGGHCRIGMGHGSTTDSLDPATYENGYINTLTHNTHARLTEVAPDISLRGEVAESWEASTDASVWTFKLRKGVEFHNGKTVTAEDVIASYNHHRGEDSKSAAAPIVAPITDIKADGDDTVVFTLESGNADFPFIATDYHLAILPSKDGKPDVTTGTGAGSYKLAQHEPGVRSSVERFENHWDLDNRAFFDSGEILSIIDANARQNALVTGSIEVADRIDLKTVELLKRKPGVVVEDVTGYGHYTFPMLIDVPPFDNNDVRMALKLSLDREQLLQKILKGYGSVGNDHPISPANRYMNRDMPQRSYDPEKAKWHLKQAGQEGLTVELSASDAAFAGAVDAAVLYKEHAAAAGINIEVVREPGDGYWSNVWLKKPWCACYWGGRPTEDWMFSTAYQSGVPWNDTNFNNERFDTLLTEARAELDETKRRAMYYEMQEIVANEGGTVVPFFYNYVNAHSDKIILPEVVAGNWELDGARLLERWWFA